MRKPFKPWEKDFIRLVYPDFSNKEIALFLKRTIGVIQVFASCSSLKKEEHNLVKQKFGKLLVLKQMPSKKQEKRWKCKCDCGNYSECSTHTLLKGHSKSCGCERLKSISHGYDNISGTWFGNLARGAKKRKIEFSLTKEYLNQLLINQNFKCALSGLDIYISQVRSGQKYFEENTASLDRINNDKGYVEGNVQFLHKHINYMKWTHNQEYFKKLCKKVTNYVYK